jgi:hypothetical protein
MLPLGSGSCGSDALRTEYRRRQGSPATHCRRSRRQRSLGGDRATVAVVINILGRTAGAISIRYLADWRRRTVMHRDANPTLNSSIAPCRSCTESRGSACGLARNIGPVVVERSLSAGNQRDVGLDVVTVSYQRDGRHRGRPGGLRRGPGHDDGVIAAEAVAVIGLGWQQEQRRRGQRVHLRPRSRAWVEIFSAPVIPAKTKRS